MTQLGMVYIRMKRYAPGRLILQKALEIDHENIETHITLAYCLLCQKDLEQSLKHYLSALEFDNNSFKALNGIGVTYMMFYLNDRENEKFGIDALECWHRSLEIKPDQAKIRKLLARYGKEIHASNKIETLAN